MVAAIETLASLPASGGYISPLKWLIMLAGVVGWLEICQWVDKDAWRLHYKRFAWNGVAVGAGALGLLLWLLIPMFIAGFAAYLLVLGAGIGAYVHCRNKLVTPASRVLTADHLRNLFTRQLPRARPDLPPVKLLTTGRHAIPPLPENDPMYQGYESGEMLLADALQRRAEKVAVIPSGHGAAVQYTIDGLASSPAAIDRHVADLMISYFKRIAGMDVNDRRRPQKGRLFSEEPSQPVDPEVLAAGYNVPQVLPPRNMSLEVLTSGTRAGESMTLRLTNEAEQLTLDNLGMTERQLQLLAEFRKQPGGLVVMGAADGAGSTTTFYQVLKAHDAFMTNIQTLEEQPDEELENISQHVYKQEAAEEMSFARQLQSIVRKGPDIIGVSLCKDKETAQIVARASADQAKFYIEMAGRDTFTLLARWAALVGDLKLAMTPLRLVFAQTLVRKLCPGCREAYRPDPQLLRKINLPADRIDRLFRSPGRPPTDKHGNPLICPLCQGLGYVGRTAVFEALVVDDELRRLAIGNASANDIKKYCRTQKMLYLQEEALRKVVAGETGINEVVRVFGGEK